MHEASEAAFQRQNSRQVLENAEAECETESSVPGTQESALLQRSGMQIDLLPRGRPGTAELIEMLVGDWE